MSEYVLELKGITKIFPGVKALNNVQFQLKPGEVHALMGENGAGKSTFIKVITGVHKAEEGEMYLFGKEAYEELPSNVFEYTPEIVCSEEGVYPEQIPVLLAITGDPGDEIPGCKGVSSAAAPLVAEYKTLDAIYEAIEDCEDVAKKEKELNTFWKENLGIGRSPLKALKTNKEMVYLSEQLATMKRDIEIKESLEDMRLHINAEELIRQLKRYEMNSILTEYEKTLK